VICRFVNYLTLADLKLSYSELILLYHFFVLQKKKWNGKFIFITFQWNPPRSIRQAWIRLTFVSYIFCVVIFLSRFVLSQDRHDQEISNRHLNIRK